MNWRRRRRIQIIICEHRHLASKLISYVRLFYFFVLCCECFVLFFSTRKVSVSRCVCRSICLCLYFTHGSCALGASISFQLQIFSFDWNKRNCVIYEPYSFMNTARTKYAVDFRALVFIHLLCLLVSRNRTKAAKIFQTIHTQNCVVLGHCCAVRAVRFIFF